MRAVVAIDFRGRSDGALHFAHWLRQASGAVQQVRGIHVISEEQIEHMRVVRQYDDLQYYAKRGVDQTLERLSLQHEFDGVEIVDGGAIADELARYAANQDADFLMIGRVAPRTKDTIVRLGGVARRLLRELPRPVVVVPPDVARDESGRGPVLVAVDGTDASLQACRFAEQFARAVGREVVMTHVVGLPDGWGYGFVSSQALEGAMSNIRAEGVRSIERWAQSHALGGHRLVVSQGVVAREVALLADELDACLVVTGSRKLGAVERIFVTSIGSELAASAHTPVAVVPNAELVLAADLLPAT